MDITLNRYINRANEIVATYSNPNIKNTLKKKERKKYNNEFKHMICFLQESLQKVKDQFEKFIVLNGETTISNTIINPNLQNKYIKNVNIINSYILIPNKVDLAWIQDLNQYSLKINNLVLRGNIGNIYDKKILKNERVQANQVIICANGNNCNNILSKKYCKFYHDPLDLIELKNNKIITDEFYQNTIKYTRNFSNTSWIYDSEHQNKNMRSIGSKSALANDILLYKTSMNYKTQIDNIKAQVMHDLLVLLVLNEQGMA